MKEIVNVVSSYEDKKAVSAIDQVRDLVFGQQMQSYDKRFLRAEADLKETSDELKALNEETSRVLTTFVVDKERNLENRIQRLETSIAETRADLEARIRQLDEKLTLALDQESALIRKEHVNRRELSRFLMEMGGAFAVERKE